VRRLSLGGRSGLRNDVERTWDFMLLEEIFDQLSAKQNAAPYVDVR
jgi:hypothetical protein